MTAAGTVAGLARRVRSGDVSAIARMITVAERGSPAGRADLAELYRAGGQARIIGVTGPPGAGKSTLVAALGLALRRAGHTLGIVAVDPSSPYSGGSVLGDRIRMEALAGDPDVFIRSMATRGALGGLAAATADAVAVLDAAGKDVVLVETVGVGQDEVEIARAAHTVIVVSAPGLGDDVQALKAGILEIADIHVVNKADRPGADRTMAELRSMLAFAGGESGWPTPILATCAARREGVAELAAALDDHHRWLVGSGVLDRRRRDIARHRLRTLVTALVHDHLDRPAGGSSFEALVEALAERATDPWTAARAVLDAGLGGEPSAVPEPAPGPRGTP
jgi:LAO/AO transport system kinase